MVSEGREFEYDYWKTPIVNPAVKKYPASNQGRIRQRMEKGWDQTFVVVVFPFS